MVRRRETSAFPARPSLGEARRKTASVQAKCPSTLAGLVAGAAIVFAVATAPARAERAPFSRAVIDAAMSEPDLRYSPSEACPGPAYSTLRQVGTSYCVLRPSSRESWTWTTARVATMRYGIESRVMMCGTGVLSGRILSKSSRTPRLAIRLKTPFSYRAR